MGKTVKSRILFSITTFICVVVLCVIASNGIPSLYRSQKEKAALEAAAIKASQEVSKPDEKNNSNTNAPVVTPNAPVATDPVDEGSNDYDVPAEEPIQEPEQVDDVDSEEDDDWFGDDSEQESPVAPEKESFIDKVISFFTSIFETIFSGEFFTKIKDFFGNIFSLVGIK